jgi:hypothetical protein
MDAKQISLIVDFKETFGTVHGKRVLEHLKTACRARHNQNIFDPNNARQTDFNLGANWVFGYIQSQLEIQLDNEPVDCQIEPQNERIQK